MVEKTKEPTRTPWVKNEAACNRPTAGKGDVPTIARLTRLVPGVSELLKEGKKQRKRRNESWHVMGKLLPMLMSFLFTFFVVLL